MAAKDHVAVRLDPTTLERMDIVREVLSTEWHEASQSDVLRALIFGGLKVVETEHAARIAEIKKRREGDKREAPATEKAAPPKRARKPKS